MTEEKITQLAADIGLDPDEDAIARITPLVLAAQDYIEVSTGVSVADQAKNNLAYAATKFLVTQWYYADHADDQSLTRSLKYILTALKYYTK